jgi:glycosyltransferase involved in cell wall biosynthesis
MRDGTGDRPSPGDPGILGAVDLPVHDDGPSLSIVVAAFREAGSIAKIVRTILDVVAALGCSYELLVVDDGSPDGTGDLAAEAGACVLRHPYNRGKGASLKTGIRAARGATVITLDADGQHDPRDIPKLLECRPAFDMVIGDRGPGGGQSPGWRRPGKALLGAVANVLTNRRIPDLNCGFRVADRLLFTRLLPILPDGFSFETNITIAAIKTGHTVTWVPINIHPRTGKSTVSISDGFNTLMLIIRIIALYAPLRVFMPVTGVTLVAGLWFVVDSYVRFGEASVKGILTLLGAVLFFLFGLLADQIAALRRGEQVS